MLKINKRSAGFTLIETLIALSVLALGIAGVAKLTQIGYQHVSLTEGYRQAAYLAHGHLTTLSMTSDLQTRYQTGHYNERLSWTLSLTPVNSETLPAIMEITDKVEALHADLRVWIEGGSRSLDFHTLVFSNKGNVDVIK